MAGSSRAGSSVALGRDELADADVVRDAVEVAIEVAGLTCGRAGADPPRRDEVARLAG